MTREPARYIDPAAVKRIKQEMDSLQYLTDLRLRQAQERENCLLVLASALLRLRHGYGLSWEEIAQKIDGISDRSHAHRIARREKGLSRITYQLAVTSINSLLLANHDTIINFPEYPISGRGTGK